MDRKNKALADIMAAMEKPKEEKKDTAAGSLQDIISAALSEPNAKKRRKMLQDFSARHADVADFLAENTELINAEAEAALIGAAVGGTYTDTEVSYKGGVKHTVKKKKRVQPNVAALNIYLKNRMPEKYSDKPQTETEVEDVSEINEVIDNAAEGQG